MSKGIVMCVSEAWRFSFRMTMHDYLSTNHTKNDCGGALSKHPFQP